MEEPRCKYHPDRLGVAHYYDAEDKKKYGYSLCLECLDKRLYYLRRLPLDDHGRRMEDADKQAIEERDE